MLSVKKWFKQNSNHFKPKSIPTPNKTEKKHSSFSFKMNTDYTIKHVESFGEDVMSTGVNISAFFMVLLIGLFSFQSARKIFNYYKLQSKLNDVPDVLQSSVAPLISYNIGMSFVQINFVNCNYCEFCEFFKLIYRRFNQEKQL